MTGDIIEHLKDAGAKPQPSGVKDGSDDAAVPPPELQKAKDVIGALTKAIKTSKLYPESNPIYQKFIEELKDKFNSYIEEYGDLKLRLTQFKLLYKGIEIYDNPDKLENIALKLFTDGVREITFHEGLDDLEILNFLDVLNTNLDPEKTDDDMVTLLWEKNFQCITYFVIEEAGEGDAKAETLTTRTPIQEFVKAQEMDAAQKKHLEKESGMPVTEERIKVPAPETPVFSVYTLTEEEIELLKKEKEAEENPSFTFKIIDILNEILYLERDIKAFSDIVDTLEKALDLLISKADLVRASRLLKNLREIAEAKGKFSDEEVKRINRAIERAGDEIRIKEFGAMLGKNQTIDLNALSSYLSLLHKNSIAYLLELLEVNNLNIRKHICDVMVEVVKDDVDIIGRRVNDKRWYIVRNIAYILGRLGKAKGIEYLKRALKHDEPRVRLESIKSLMQISGDQAKDMLLTVIADANSQVRIQAIRGLLALNHKKAVQPLMEFISHEEFKKIEFAEKREFFEALGKLGANEVVPFLKNIYTKKPWFGRSSYDELRTCAVYGLSKTGTNDALSVLQSLKEKPGSKIESVRLRVKKKIK
ncbi:MAG: HEAT repeat domain-containing protein, partial [Nitrospirae bacterium]|nr:HEAT repeat domain-containing protein [Nitrospirota bacterium]